MTLTLQDIITRDRGHDAYLEFATNKIADASLITQAAKQTLEAIPPAFGSCVMVSTGFVAILKSVGIEAVVILGDLKIDGHFIFECRGNIPGATYEGEVVNATWDGHAWVMLGNLVCDLSIFRTAYALPDFSLLKNFMRHHFGEGKGALLCPPGAIPLGMEFVPKHALNDDQIHGILEGLSRQSKERESLS
ncbi:hypothetical protein [Pseudomonas alloputida]|uniref:hypothetical protein n=1 Tax=Pseudomonas TaxID=286 RepID=UPI003EEC4C07